MTIDDAGSVSGSALGRTRAAALAELRRQPLAVSWRRDAARTLLAVLGTTALVVGVGALVSIVEPGRLGERLLQVALLVALAVARPVRRDRAGQGRASLDRGAPRRSPPSPRFCSGAGRACRAPSLPSPAPAVTWPSI